MEKTFSKSGSRYSFVSLVLFVIALAGAVFYLKPAWDDVSSLSKGRDEKVQIRQTAEQKLESLKKVQQDLNLVSEVDRQTSLNSIPERFEEDNLILEISTIARKNNMTMGGLNFSIPTNTPIGEISRATINTNVTGQESDLLGFLSGIEANGRKIVVKSITVQLGAGGVDAPGKSVNFNLNMETFFQGKI